MGFFVFKRDFYTAKTIYGIEDEHDTPYLTKIGAGRLFLHIFHRPDQDPYMHDHPWDFWTFPLTNYVEEVPLLRSNGSPVWFENTRRVVRRFKWHFREAEYRHKYLGKWDTSHCVFRMEGDEEVRPHTKPGRAYTLVWQMPKRRKWGFWKVERAQWTFIPWEKYMPGETA